MKDIKNIIKSGFIPEGYENWRQGIVTLIAQAKYKVVLNANAELLALYWKIGTDIIKKTERTRLGNASYRPAIKRFDCSISRWQGVFK